MTQTNQFSALFVFQDKEKLKQAQHCFELHYNDQTNFISFASLAQAIEYIEINQPHCDLVIFEHYGIAKSVVNLLLDMNCSKQYIMCVPHMEMGVHYSVPKEAHLEYCSGDLTQSLPVAIKKIKIHKKKEAITNRTDYIQMRPQVICSIVPSPVDVYLGLTDSRFIKVFRAGDVLSPSDLEKHLEKTEGVPNFFYKKEEIDAFLKAQTDQIAKLSEKQPLDEEKAREAYLNSHDTLREAVADLGFTPESEKVTRACVDMTVKLVGKNPVLSSILSVLEQSKGSYLASHSLMLGRIACSLAHRIGWGTESNFLKLSLAAFLHDLPLKDDELAREVSYEAAVKSEKYSSDELKLLRFHPQKAAEFSVRFKGVPFDVDQILSHHHEKPDGSGFPKELKDEEIAPLSALFIIAHELIEYSNTHSPFSIEKFLEENEYEFAHGQFRKIFKSIQEGTELPLPKERRVQTVLPKPGT